MQKDIRRHLEGNLDAYHGEKNKNERYHQEKKEIFYREEEKTSVDLGHRNDPPTCAAECSPSEL